MSYSRRPIQGRILRSVTLDFYFAITITLTLSPAGHSVVSVRINDSYQSVACLFSNGVADCPGAIFRKNRCNSFCSFCSCIRCLRQLSFQSVGSSIRSVVVFHFCIDKSFGGNVRIVCRFCAFKSIKSSIDTIYSSISRIEGILQVRTFLACNIRIILTAENFVSSLLCGS